MASESEEKKLLPHHKQQELCTTRLPYRQGRKLTAVKTYTVNNESNHLLIFGVPALNLRREAKALFRNFGPLISFTVTEHAVEAFTESYHAVFEAISSARLAKKILDGKNFYGGSLHVCYAPEYESIEQTRDKLLKRQKDVLLRLKNLQREREKLRENQGKETEENTQVVRETNNLGGYPTGLSSGKDKNAARDIAIPRKLNMGEINTICIGKQIRDVVFNKKVKKRKPGKSILQPKLSKRQNNASEPSSSHSLIDQKSKIDNNITYATFSNNSQESMNITQRKVPYNANMEYLEQNKTDCNEKDSPVVSECNEAISGTRMEKNNIPVDVIDFTSAEQETLTNINDVLNYDKFGSEVIKKIEQKPLNKIRFHFGNKRQ